MFANQASVCVLITVKCVTNKRDRWCFVSIWRAGPPGECFKVTSIANVITELYWGSAARIDNKQVLALFATVKSLPFNVTILPH